MSKTKQKKGCGNIPISLLLIILMGSFWGVKKLELTNAKRINQILATIPGLTIHLPEEEVVAPAIVPTPSPNLPPEPQANVPPVDSAKSHSASSAASLQELDVEESEQNVNPEWNQKVIRGIYLSRYQVTNFATESQIRDRVRHYKTQGFNTIIHGVWGNACTMYKSQVMQKTLGYDSCPNKFRARWLDWLIDEAQQQGMEVHAYFEKGIKIDQNSPIFDWAIANNWMIPGVDRTYQGVEHYLLDVANPDVANFFHDIVEEFVQQYPEIDAVQWDDYLGYHAELPGNVDRTEDLTQFVQGMIKKMKQANSQVSFDLCHHNPYWAKRYFAADWKNWDVDRVFIQNYNEKNFAVELDYVNKYDGIAITDQQFHRMREILDNQRIKSVLIFALSGNPEQTASQLGGLLKEIEY